MFGLMQRDPDKPQSPMSLTPDEIARYRRHLVLREVGGQGQQQLKAAKVLCIGAGGLGSPLLLYLAAAGIGTIGVIDDDSVSLDNLQRQIVHDTTTVGEPKVASAAETLERLNPHVAVVPHKTRLTAANALDIIRHYDLVADGSDNFTTRYLVNDACYLAAKPLVLGAVGPLDGQLTSFRAFEKDAQGNPKPSYRCLFPEPPPPGTVAPCSEIGVLGAAVGVIGTLMAVEVVKELLGIGQSLTGRLMLYDAMAPRFDLLSYRWDPDNPLNGRNPSITDLSIHARAGDEAVEACAAPRSQ
jgi:adenylyltransferase/sulfurtransferase